ncbi:polygalacturonase-like [Musa acuminata AAA Group]|uniref:polygalacturonase-like n=1 Tax=Musa acuminata AAA Group TaxID=214697 RepID=UPI0031DC083E
MEYGMRGTREGNDSDPRGSIPARSNNLQRAMQRHNGDASGGRFNGQGASAWPYNQCKKTNDCKPLPMCSQDSPNTDGIHIADSTNIQVANSVIGTGDDCISIGPGCTNLTIFKVLCGPGHGISVGSLGKNAGEKDVIGLNVSNCNLTGTTNGLRIKTLQSSPSRLKATDFVFEHIIMNNVYNPIIINQNYCPSANCPKKDPSLVKIKNIKYRNIVGTFLSPIACNLVCSEVAPCEGVELSDISLKYNGNEKQPKNASICVHVYGSSNGNVKPDPCI